jgi:hypothetical protein
MGDLCDDCDCVENRKYNVFNHKTILYITVTCAPMTLVPYGPNFIIFIKKAWKPSY